MLFFLVFFNFVCGRRGTAIDHLIFLRVDGLVLAYSGHDLRAVSAQGTILLELVYSVAHLAVLLR